MKIKLINHPHAGKMGTIKVSKSGKVDVETILGKDMVKVKLDEGGSCFAEAHQIQLMSARPRKV